MSKKFVKIIFDLHCTWEGYEPEYRIFVDDELFTERTYSWDESQYVHEILQVEAEPGVYQITLEKLEPCSAEFEIKNPVIAYGPGEILNNGRFRIL